MARQRSPNREKAFEIFKEHSGNITNRKIAELLDVPEKTIGGWKVKDKWNEQLNGVLQINKRSTPKRGAPKENKNAAGNKGGKGGPARNSKALKHGFFRTIFPDDEETHAILDEINNHGPIDIIWNNIMIQYTAIARAQKLMFVRDQDDTTKELKKNKRSYSEKGGFSEEEYELQFAWDKHATFLQAQSRAMKTLEGLIAQYDRLCNTDEQRLRIEKLRAEIAVIEQKNQPPEGVDISAYVEALKGRAAKVWDEHEEE